MKKILIAILSFLLIFSICACGKSNNSNGDYLYESLDDDNMNNILSNYPTSIIIMADELACGYMVEDSAEILEIVEAFTNMTIGDEIEMNDGKMINITFNFGSKSYDLSFDGNTIFVENTNGETFYALDNYNQFRDVIINLISNHFELNKEYQNIIMYGPVKISLAGINEIENGNLEFDINAKNESTDTYAFKLNAEVNGYTLNTYQTIFLSGESDNGYMCQIPSNSLKKFGIDSVDELRYSVTLYKGDSETLEIVEKIAKSEIYTVSYNGLRTYEVVGNAIYEDNGCRVLYKTDVDSYGYTSLYLYFENTNENDVTFKINEVKYNGEIMDISDVPEFTSVNVTNGTFVNIPLYNFTWDEEKQESTIIPIESMSLVLALETDSGIIEIPEIILK